MTWEILLTEVPNIGKIIHHPGTLQSPCANQNSADGFFKGFRDGVPIREKGLKVKSWDQGDNLMSSSSKTTFAVNQVAG